MKVNNICPVCGATSCDHILEAAFNKEKREKACNETNKKNKKNDITRNNKQGLPTA